MYRVLHGHDPNDVVTRYLERGIAALILISVTFDLVIDIQSTNLLLILMSN